MSKHPDLVALGKQIRQLREARGYSQEGFASEVGIARGYYGSLERGECNITALKIFNIARALQVPVSKLFALADKRDSVKKKG